MGGGKGESHKTSKLSRPRPEKTKDSIADSAAGNKEQRTKNQRMLALPYSTLPCLTMPTGTGIFQMTTRGVGVL